MKTLFRNAFSYVLVVFGCFSAALAEEEFRYEHYVCANTTSGSDETASFIRNYEDRALEKSMRLHEKLVEAVLKDVEHVRLRSDGSIIFENTLFLPETVEVAGNTAKVDFVLKEEGVNEILSYTRLLPDKSNAGALKGFKIISTGCDLLNSSCRPAIKEFACKRI